MSPGALDGTFELQRGRALGKILRAAGASRTSISSAHLDSLGVLPRQQTSEGHLAQMIARSWHGRRRDEAMARADELIGRDDHQRGQPFGQRLRDTFPRADVFIAVHRPDDATTQVRRFVDLLFAHPFHTPTQDEVAMFQARAAALRSADLSRQVGAVIATASGEVISVGTNEVPTGAGGQYWPDSKPDGRDFQRGDNESFRIRRSMLAELLQRMGEAGWLADKIAEATRHNVDAVVEDLLPRVRDSVMMSVGEFGRTVHAEMAALMDAARRGVAVRGTTLFSTTFPCHNCTKHIAAAGISRVVYIEPFPKSRAGELHDDAIEVDGTGRVEGKVNFGPFVGVALGVTSTCSPWRHGKHPMERPYGSRGRERYRDLLRPAGILRQRMLRSSN